MKPLLLALAFVAALLASSNAFCVVCYPTKCLNSGVCASGCFCAKQPTEGLGVCVPGAVAP